MPSVKYCCVPGCKESGGMHKVLHGFPNLEQERERLRFNTWLYAIGGDILDLENDYIHKYCRVCHSHFEERCLCRYNRISNAAIPTLNLPDKLLLSRARVPMQERQLNQPNPSSSKDPYQPIASASLPHVQSESISDKENQKENIDPGFLRPANPLIVLSTASIPLAVQSTTISNNDKLNLSACSRNVAINDNIGVRPRMLKKINTRRAYLNDGERHLHKQIVASKIKLCKMKNKI